MGPIEACQHFDIFDDELIQRMRTYYESIGTYRSPVMNKADPGKALKWVEPFLYKLYPDIGRFLRSFCPRDHFFEILLGCDSFEFLGHE